MVLNPRVTAPDEIIRRKDSATSRTKASAPRRPSGNRTRTSISLVSLAAAVLVAACAGQTEPPVPARGPDRASGVEPRYDPVVEMAEEIRQTLSRCWAIDPNEPATVVAVEATLDSDGMVLEAEPSDPDRYRTDATYRSAAERAVRAVMNPSCQPLPFSAEDWPSWQKVTFVFNPNSAFDGN